MHALPRTNSPPDAEIAIDGWFGLRSHSRFMKFARLGRVRFEDVNRSAESRFRQRKNRPAARERPESSRIQLNPRRDS